MENSMLVAAMEWVEERAGEPTLAVDGRLWVQRRYHEVTPCRVDALSMDGLSAVVGYLRLPEADNRGRFVIVRRDHTVQVVGHPDPTYRAREVWLAVVPAALPAVANDTRGSFYSAEQLIPMVMRGFDDSNARAALLKVLGNVRDGATRTFADDGVTQEVTVRTGATLKGLAELPNPVTLHPYGLYGEITVPARDYVLRARGGDDENPPTFSLTPVEDVLWTQRCTRVIVEYLEHELAKHGLTIPVVG